MSTEAEKVAELAQQAITPVVATPGTVVTAPDGNGGVQILDTDKYSATPRHTEAKRKVSTAASFVDYVNRHKRPGTEVFAHVLSLAVAGIIDSHEGTGLAGGWQKHRVDLELEHTPAWKAWIARDLGAGQPTWFGQQEFAEFIEARALDVTDPDTATLIEIATTFEAKQRAEFGSAVRLESGAVKFEYSETVAAKAGQKGHLEIPKEFTLALRPYVGGPVYKLVAQFRYRISGSGLMLGYALVRPEAVLEAAFADIVTEIRDGKHDAGEWPDHPGIGDVPIFFGKP